MSIVIVNLKSDYVKIIIIAERMLFVLTKVARLLALTLPVFF